MFRIIGELINTTRTKIEDAVANHDEDYIKYVTLAQIEAGASWVDVNGGARPGREAEDMNWLLDVVQEVSGDTPLSLDSSSPEILQMAYKKSRVKPMINSISLESARWEGLASYLPGKDCDILALCMDDTGLPKTLDQTLERASRLVAGLQDLGFTNNAIYIDPLIQPISTDISKGKLAMDAVWRIRDGFPGVHTCCGLSNISYGLPKRKTINRYFISMMVAHGLDSAILNPLDQRMMAAVWTSQMLAGKDRFCRTFLSAVRADKFHD